MRCNHYEKERSDQGRIPFSADRTRRAIDIHEGGEIDEVNGTQWRVAITIVVLRMSYSFGPLTE
jgi:hypothetical protein